MKKNQHFTDQPWSGIKKLLIVMKLTAVLLFLSGIAIAAGTYGQETRFDLNMKDVTIIQLFDEIEHVTEFGFLFKTDQLDLNRHYTLDFKKASIDQILNEVLDRNQYNYTVIDRNIVITKVDANQDAKTKKVSGKVTDSSGASLPGVSVGVKGTTIGVITGSDGNFSLTIPSDAKTLLFSFVGMKTQEVAIGNQTKINITLAEETVGIEEVVAIGYGTQKKSNLTAAVSVVDMRALENRPVVSVSEMLRGNVANLNLTTTTSAPGQNPSLNIRGFTGLNSSASPLIVVDGVPQDIENINSNDIESISVLKDAAASAIYGSRAPNGVIIVTTKTGKKNTKMKFNYSGNLRVSSPLNMPKALNGYDFVLLNNESGYNSQTSPEYPAATVQRIKDYIDGKITDNNIIVSGKWGGPFDANASEDYIDNTFKDVVFNTSHNFSMSGGGDKTTYYAGVGYLKDQGIYESDIDKNQRKFVTIKIDSDINKWLSLGINTKYTRQETMRPNIRTAADNDQSLLDGMIFRPNIPNVNHAIVNGVEYSGYNEFSISPSLNGDGGKVERKIDNLLTTFSGELKPFDGLKIRGSYTWSVDNQKYYIEEFKYLALQPDGTFNASRRSVNQERLRKWRYNNEYSNSDLTATYSKFFGKHDFNAMVGYQKEVNNYDMLFVSNTDFYTTSVPSFSTMYGSNSLIDDDLYGWATQGYFGRMSYNYEGRYLFDFNGRYDASSRYSTESRWSFFPSASAGYNIAREKFWPFKDQISMFKIKGSWGSLGNAGTGRPLYLAPLGTGSQISQVLGNVRPPYVTMPGIVSADLTWTKPRTIGFGAEIAALKNRLTFEYNWYQRTVYDETGVAEQLPEVLGTNPPVRNNAISETRGWEVSAEWKDRAFNIGGEALSYGVKLLLSDYIGYVVEYVDNTTGIRTGWTPGQPFGVVYGYESAGIQTTAEDLQNHVSPDNGWYYPGDLFFKDMNGDGRIGSGDGNYWYSEGDRIKLGYNYPRYKYSIMLNAGWKNLSLFVLLDGVGKQVQYFNNKFTTGAIDIGSRGLLDFQGELGYWNKNNQDAFFPRLYTGTKNFGTANDQYMLNLAHLRIKNINLDYNIPIKSDVINSLTVNLSIENAGMIFYKSWDKLDPQLLLYPTYPPSRMFSFGVKCSF